MKKVLFICTGNTCRSPMAEGFFNKLAPVEAPEWQASSAGLGAYGAPEPATSHAKTAASEHDVDLSDHSSQQLSQALVDDADLLLTMTTRHKRDVLARFDRAADNTHTLMEFVGKEGCVDDPMIDGSPEAYRDCAEQIMGEMEGIFHRLSTQT